MPARLEFPINEEATISYLQVQYQRAVCDQKKIKQNDRVQTNERKTVDEEVKENL